MTLVRGAAGAGGNFTPPVPTGLSIRRKTGVASGSNPGFGGSYVNAYGSPSKYTGRTYTIEAFKTSDNTSVGTYTFTVSTWNEGGDDLSSGITLTKGTSYYYKVKATDTRTGLTGGFSAASPSITVLTLPSQLGTYSSVTGGTLTVSATWGAPTDNGGETVSYDWQVRLNSNGSLIDSGNTSSTTKTVDVAAGTYYFEVFPKNALGQGPGRSSSAVTAVAPPFFPFFPSFGPFFPYFPFFPSFGPYFPSFGGGGCGGCPGYCSCFGSCIC